MRRRRRLPEEHTSHERWLVSYADFITLLFAFFVVMYSISQVNDSKYRVLSDTLTAVFNRPEVSLDPFQVGDVARSNPMNTIELDGRSGSPHNGGEGHRHGAQPEAFVQISERIAESLGALIRQRLVRISGTEAWLEIELSSSLLFASGDAELSVPAMEILGKVAAALHPHENAVRVEGFTDNVPINTHQFPSNWELSGARAAAVVRLFVEEGIAPERLSAVGYGEFRPAASNADAAGRARNRRVVLKVSRDAPPTTDGALSSAAPGTAEQEPRPAATETGAAGTGAAAGEPRPLLESRGSPDAAAGVRTVELEDGALLYTRDVARGNKIRETAAP